MKVFVGNLPYTASEQELRDFFEVNIGAVNGVQIIKDHATGQSRGFGFVSFVANQDVEGALTLHGTLFGGRPLVVKDAKPRAARSA